MPKRSLRQKMLELRRALSHEKWLESSRLVQANFLSLKEYSESGCIALYAPAHNEPDTFLILESAFLMKKRVLYPALCGHKMVFRQVEGLDCFSRGSFGILEPCFTGADYPADEADLIVTPGIVFDHIGHRIGYGRGYYDRFVGHAKRKASLVGLCHDFQLIDQDIPAEKHDVRMEIIVTEQRVIRCGSNRRCHDGPDLHRRR